MASTVQITANSCSKEGMRFRHPRSWLNESCIGHPQYFDSSIDDGFQQGKKTWLHPVKPSLMCVFQFSHPDSHGHHDSLVRLRQRAREVIKANEGSPDLQDKLLKGKGPLDPHGSWWYCQNHAKNWGVKTLKKCGKANYQPTIWGWFIQAIYLILGMGLWVFLPHFFLRAMETVEPTKNERYSRNIPSGKLT